MGNLQLETLRSPGTGISWKPWEANDQEDYIIWCDHWDGSWDGLNCNYDEHPEKDAFENFSDRDIQVRMTSSPQTSITVL